jgi:hypothetical protein
MLRVWTIGHFAVLTNFDWFNDQSRAKIFKKVLDVHIL